ncbi:MAG: hypothetical protein P4L59_15860 [Desulfosporosinus sp.]|nr:hypothetical protein [Desulfosporosinus sp.]
MFVAITTHRGNRLDEAKTNVRKEASGQGFLVGKIHHDILHRGKRGYNRVKALSSLILWYKTGLIYSMTRR